MATTNCFVLWVMFLKAISTNLDKISENWMFLIRAGNALNDKGSSTLVFCLASNVLFEANHLVLTFILVHVTE